MSTVRHGDYQGEVVFENGRLVLRILHIDDLITTEVDSASEVEAAFAELVDDYLASCAELGREADRPFRGLFNVRVPPQLHKQVAFAAANDRVTLNAYVLAALEQKVASDKFEGDHSDAAQASTCTGILRLSLVTCPVTLVPAMVGEYGLGGTGGDILIDIEQFVSKHEVDQAYLSDLYYMVPNGPVGHDAFAVIREVMKATNKVALAWVRSGQIDHAIVLEPREAGMYATVLRIDQVFEPTELFQSIKHVHVTKDMINLARHIVEAKAALFDLRKLKRAKKRKRAADEPELASPHYGENVIDLIEALRRSKNATNDDADAPRRKA
jgi:non-homologous end joining protein Ku/predicted HicB family RNase H-like nuclease